MMDLLTSRPSNGNPSFTERAETTSRDATGVPAAETRAYQSIVHDGGVWWAMACLAAFLLCLCALLAGLTLGVCGLDTAWLQMRTITGTAKERKQALVVARMKRRGTWMLCSLIICSVACSEYFPFAIKSLCQTDQEWLAVVISTVLIAVFAELIPQWLIPHRAISWGYYCWPVIWGAMWLTVVISYPLACILDYMGNFKIDHLAVFTNDQLAIIIRYHERSRKRGGQLSHDATRILLGVLSSEGRRIGRDIVRIPGVSCDESDRDVEKAELTVNQGVIVKWAAVKAVDINEVVDHGFIQKIKQWSYSRIPVIGHTSSRKSGLGSSEAQWEGRKVFGYLHTKNLVGLELGGRTLMVKDLILYPMPIVRDDMAVFELLNMFQLGISRIAIVIPSEPQPLGPNDTGASRSQTWTASLRTNARVVARMNGYDGRPDWAAHYIDAAQVDLENSKVDNKRVCGVDSPKPIGIITFEDIIDTILQKTSRDETDFFDRNNSLPLTKTKKLGDFRPTPSPGPSSTVASVSNITTSRPDPGTLRKRKTGGCAGVDGADDHSSDIDAGLLVAKVRMVSGESSYTQNSRGGFHGAKESTSLSEDAIRPEDEDITSLANPPCSYHLHVQCPPVKTTSLPSRRVESSVSSASQSRLWRDFSAAPALRQTAPSSTRRCHSGEKRALSRQEQVLLATPNNVILSNGILQSGNVPGDQINNSRCAEYHAQEHGDKEISLSSWYGDITDHEDGLARIFNADPVQHGSTLGTDQQETLSKSRILKPAETCYDGFPPELLENYNENQIKYISNTMPRLTGLPTDKLYERLESETPSREKSFHDDRALLPSQRRALNESINIGGARSSSLWF